MNIVIWGDNHRRGFKDIEEARNFAYNKAFYFETYLNGRRIDRIF